MRHAGKHADEAAARHFIDGQQLAQAGRLTEAKAAYRRSIDLNGDFLPGVFALGRLLEMEGNFAAAHPLLSRALRLSKPDGSERALIAPALAEALSLLLPDRYDEAIERDVLACFDVPQVDAQSLSQVTARLLLLKYPEGQALDEALGRDPLWVALLTGGINTHPPMERRLAAARGALLERFGTMPTLPHAIARSACALALQAFANQYVWPESGAERLLLKVDTPPLLRALYRPLGEFASAGDAKKLKRDRLSTLLVKRSFADPERERALAAAAAPIGGGSDDAVSAKVREQYEQHPYPRWRAPPAPRPTDLRDSIVALPGVNAAILPPSPLDILIAGCGTGYEPIGIARTNPSLAITAIDLSRASLGYAMRMADELEVTNVTFRHGDILDLDALGRQFDVAYSTGVLHHMDRPEAGLASICGVVKPGGVLRLALYSARARLPIRAAHALIRERGWQPVVDDIRSFRAEILALPANAGLASLRDADDFYSLSGCRDLAFHAHEHHFSLPGIAALLHGAGLRLIGFEADPDILALFRDRFGRAASVLDLGLWEVLEADHPALFVGMYHFWAQKPA